MAWARMLAYITGMVDRELLLRNEYLATENRILKAQVKGRLLLSDAERKTLAEVAHRLGRKALEDIANEQVAPVEVEIELLVKRAKSLLESGGRL